MVNSKNKILDPPAKRRGIFYLRAFVCALILFISVNSYSQPKLQITEAKKNFGAVKRGEVIRNDYEISNAGDAPLIISDVEVACSCTSVEFSKKPVLPGQKALVTVIFNTTTTYGRQDRTVDVISNDPKGPHKLRYKGNVINTK